VVKFTSVNGHGVDGWRTRRVDHRPFSDA
jgi:hypothetical protein